MSQTEVFKGDRYEIVAWARDQVVLRYFVFGSYQGEWVIFAKSADGSMFYVYKGWYGSCSGCDAFEGWSTYGEDVTKEKAMEFAKDYPSFLEIPRETLTELVKDNALLTVFPANTRDQYSEVSLEEVVADCTVIGKLECDVSIQPADVFATKNQELRRRAMEACGVESILEEMKSTEIDRQGADALIELHIPGESAGHRYLLLQDRSTPRRYLLRVPPDSKSVQGAKAWSFGLQDPDSYRPLIET